MRIGYAKLGRSFPLNRDKVKTLGGDVDVVNLLDRLARSHPGCEFVLVGRNSRENPSDVGLPPNVTNPWTGWHKKVYTPTVPEFIKDPRGVSQRTLDSVAGVVGDYCQDFDGFIVWAGQHGSANSPIPQINSDWFDGYDSLTKPHYSFTVYCGWLLHIISKWREVDTLTREEVWLCPDPRNYLKCRELRWPLRFPVLAQYEMSKRQKHERYDDFLGLEGTWRGKKEKSVWVSETSYSYAAVELTALPEPTKIPKSKAPGEIEFGMVINENRKEVKISRLKVVSEWVIGNIPDAVLHGKWSDESQKKLGVKIEPIPYDSLFETLRSFRSTFTTPASGSGWCTSKIWECFAAGSVCFIHPLYDSQGWAVPVPGTKRYDDSSEGLKELARFLRVKSPLELRERIAAVHDDALWRKMSELQRALFEVRWYDHRGGALSVEKRLGL
jgi:hypothetical protein